MAKEKNEERKASESNEEHLPPGIVKQFLGNQSKELENEAQQIELRRSNLEFSHEYAMRALEAQVEDRKEERGQKTLFMKHGTWFLVFLVVLFAGFVVLCINTDNVDLLRSIGKALILIVPSIIGGYFYGLNRGRKQERNERETYSAEVVDD